MRILTPAELRQIQAVKWLVTEIHNPTVVADGVYHIEVTSENRGLWLNILDLALQQNEAMREAWRKDKAPNWTDEVKDKLRPNG